MSLFQFEMEFTPPPVTVSNLDSPHLLNPEMCVTLVQFLWMTVLHNDDL